MGVDLCGRHAVKRHAAQSPADSRRSEQSQTVACRQSPVRTVSDSRLQTVSLSHSGCDSRRRLKLCRRASAVTAVRESLRFTGRGGVRGMVRSAVTVRRSSEEIADCN